MASTSVVYIEAVIRADTAAAPSSTASISSMPAAPPVEPKLPNPPDSPPKPKPQSAYIAPAKIASPPEPIGYLPFEAVDQAAVPLGDWMIDTDMLPPGQALRVVLKLWISATGVIEHWEVSGISGDEGELARKALARLSQTLIQPAFLNHIPVPSFRQLEIVLIH